jgi:hypothetical protein
MKYLAIFLVLIVNFSIGLAQSNFYITWIGVIDNGEGDDWPHGPYGNLHLQLYDCNGNEVSHTIIEGPSKKEWLDGDQGYYRIYIGNINCIYFVNIWESDKGSTMWMFGRKDDVLYQGVPDSPGIWYSGTAANADARRNAINRGANSWVKPIWNGGIQSGVPKVFIRVETF